MIQVCCKIIGTSILV